MIKIHFMQEKQLNKIKANKGTLKYICLLIVSLVVFFLVLCGVHNFFYSRVNSTISSDVSLVNEIKAKNEPVNEE